MVWTLRRAPLHLLPRHFLRLEGQDLLGGIAANVLQDFVRVLTETRRALPEWCRGLLKHKRAGNQFEPIVELHQVVVRSDLRVCGQVANSIHHREPEPFFSKDLLPMSPRVPRKGLVEQTNQFSAMLCPSSISGKTLVVLELREAHHATELRPEPLRDRHTTRDPLPIAAAGNIHQ